MSGCNSVIWGQFPEAAKKVLYDKASRTPLCMMPIPYPVAGQNPNLLTVYSFGDSVSCGMARVEPLTARDQTDGECKRWLRRTIFETDCAGWHFDSGTFKHGRSSVS